MKRAVYFSQQGRLLQTFAPQTKASSNRRRRLCRNSSTSVYRHNGMDNNGWQAHYLFLSGTKRCLTSKTQIWETNGRPKTRPEPAVFLPRGESLPLCPYFVGRHVFKSFGISCQSFLLGLFSCVSVAKSRCGVKSFHFASGLWIITVSSSVCSSLK